MNSVLKILEDPERPFLGPNYWLLKISGLILPENMLTKIFFLIMHEAVTLFVTEYVELYEIRSDLDLVLTNLKVSMLTIVTNKSVKVNLFIRQSKWRDILEYITIADKFERNNSDSVRETIINRYTKYCRCITYFYWSLVFLTFWTPMMPPVIKYASSHTIRENMRNGTEGFPHIFNSLMPFDKDHFPGCWMTVIWHTILCIYSGFIMAGYDSGIAVLMMYFGGKVDLLRKRCKQMFGSLENGISDNESAKVIRQMHGIHITLIKYSRLYNSVLSPVMFINLLISFIKICASAYQLTNMAIGTYETKWWAASGRQRKDMMILLGQFRINNVITAGSFIDLTLATFINILKEAYIYYTLLRK